VCLSLFAAPVSSLSLEGYVLAFAGVCFYNYSKLREMSNPKQAAKADEPTRAEAAKLLAAAEEGGASVK
jgi:hypothetical protein